MAFDKSAFVNDILSGVAVSPEQKQAFEGLFENPIVTKRFEEAALRQSDYSKKLDEYNKMVKAAQDYHTGLVQWQKDEQTRLEDERRKLKSLANDEGLSPDVPAGNNTYMSKEDFQKAAQEYVVYANTIATLQTQYLKEFGEILDPQKVIDVATQNGTNIRNAYDIFVQPRREEIRKAEFDKQLEEARKQGADEALKNFRIPTSDVPFNTGSPHALDAPKEGQEFGAMAAVRAWQESQKAGAPKLY